MGALTKQMGLKGWTQEHFGRTQGHVPTVDDQAKGLNQSRAEKNTQAEDISSYISLCKV
jgi:hypothetical protein